MALFIQVLFLRTGLIILILFLTTETIQQQQKSSKLVPYIGIVSCDNGENKLKGQLQISDIFDKYIFISTF